MKAKICGVKDATTLKYIINHTNPPKFVGFIINYYKSKRYVRFENLKNLLKIKKKKSKFVAVLVSPSLRFLEKIKNLNFDYYQIYDLSPEKILNIKKKYGKKIISAITISKKNDVKKYKQYKNFSDIILFDSKGYEKSLSFNHSFLNNLPKNLNIMVAGNFKPNNNFKIYKNRFRIIDISGGVESKKGVKDKEKIDQFLLNIKKTNDKN